MRNIFYRLVVKYLQSRVIRKFHNGTYKVESLGCCLCSFGEFETLAEQDRYGCPVGFAICRICGLVCQNPRPTTESLERFYIRDYRDLVRGKRGVGQEYFERGVRRGERIAEYLRKNGVSIENGTVVEIGAGPGGILKVFADQGNTVVGCDLDKNCIDLGKANGIQVLCGGIESVLSVTPSCDLVILSHILHIVPNPVDMLRRISSMLKDDGYVFVEVPSIERIGADLHRELQISHLYYFDLQTLEMTFRLAGFDFQVANESIMAIATKTEVTESIPDGNYEKNMSILPPMTES